jgi:hypothetical protein
MANPAHPTLDLDLDEGIITFSNEGVTIEAQVHIDVPHQSITVESATLTTPHDNTVDLGITNFEVPAPVAEHVFDQVTPSVASVPNATLSQEGEMVDIAVQDPGSFLHIIEGGSPAFRLPAVQGSVEGLLGGPDTRIAIDLALNPPAFGDPGGFIEQTVEQSHLTLNLTVDLFGSKMEEPEVLSYSWGSTNPETDWLIV